MVLVWDAYGRSGGKVSSGRPREVQVGVRPTRDLFGRVQGEVFIYDNVPGGAGYARAIQDSLREITELALEMGRSCPNASCSGACYHCLLGYRNQQIHNLLDRNLAIAVLEFLLEGRRHRLSRHDEVMLATGVEEYLRSNWVMLAASDCPEQFGAVFRAARDVHIGIRPLHPLSARPIPAELEKLREEIGIFPRVYTSFDLLRRPFWVANDMLRFSRH